MKTIQLTQGLSVQVDSPDYDALSKFKWCAVRLGRRKQPYAARGVNKRLVLMHRVLMNPKQGQRVDHRNGDTLDNRRENLRACSHQENSFNKKRTTKQGGRPTGLRGICWHNRLKKWQASICLNGRKVHLGYFASDCEAGRAYDRACRKMFGDFASPNHVAAPIERRIKSPLDA